MDEQLLVKGDMPGDAIAISPLHIQRAEKLFPGLQNRLKEKSTIAVCGPSGSGKSETASLLGTMCIKSGMKSYVLSCDNYAIRPPRDNENYRRELFDSGAEKALKDYLGTKNEILFNRLEQIVSDFKGQKNEIQLRFMDNRQNRIANEAKSLDFSRTDILFLEGTWSGLIENIDLIIFIEADPAKTLAHRRKRGRDPLDSFGEIVLALEQKKLLNIRKRAHLVVTGEEEILSNTSL
ncbi:adenylylsulfate kinase [Candidatus Riflebacteria bacterium]